MIENLSQRERILLRHQELIAVRQPRMKDWQDFNDYILPRRMRYLYTEKRKQTRNTKMINGTAPRAVSVLESGMMAGNTNPTRPWLRVVADPELMRITRVSQWCARATSKLLQTFLRCNLYKTLPKLYGITAVFGTGVMYGERDPVDVVRFYVLPIGQFCIDNDERGRVNTLSREFGMSVRNLVRAFGLERVSRRVKEAYRAQRYSEEVPVIHLVEPRKDRDPRKLDTGNMPWASYWIEKDAEKEAGLLRESGFKRFPFFTFRWDVTDDQNDAYGDGPGTNIIGDAIGIQLLEKRKAQAVDFVVKPPMVGPSSVKASNFSLVPSGYTPVDVLQGGQQVKAAVEVNHAAPKVIGEEIEIHGRRIKEGCFNDLWLMMASSDRREITAREVDERAEEKMVQLGPVVDRCNDEVIDPLAEFTLAALIDEGELDPPPPELIGQPIRVDNISILAQAQKLVGTVGIERLAGFTGNLASVDKGVLDNIDRDQMVRNYADMLGVDPTNLTDREKMAMERQARAEQEQAEKLGAAAQPAQQAAQAAKVLSETDVNSDSALSRLMGSIGAGDLQ